MTRRENVLSLFRRQGYEEAPYSFDLCPDLVKKFHAHYGEQAKVEEVFPPYWRTIDAPFTPADPEQYWAYYKDVKEGTHIDMYGLGHEPGSAAAKHMTRMLHPLESAQTVEEIQAYPLPNFADQDLSKLKAEITACHEAGLASMGWMQFTIWELAWYIRSMEELMVDMSCDDEKAAVLFDRLLKMQTDRALAYAKCDIDMIFLGDDIGMQHSILMSLDMYRKWIKPRYQALVKAVRAVKPDVVILYHSCGFVEPFIEDLIEIGIDVLNPIQSECMEFREIFEKYGGRISFLGTIGTQTVMPFGTPEEVRAKVRENLDIAGEKGGLLAAPTHLLEPEVPWENVVAYIDACRTYK